MYYPLVMLLILFVIRRTDRDLCVFDTESEELVEVVSNLALTLRHDGGFQGRVYIAQADARNDVNGKSGTEKHGLKQLENHAFQSGNTG